MAFQTYQENLDTCGQWIDNGKPGKAFKASDKTESMTEIMLQAQEERDVESQ